MFDSSPRHGDELPGPADLAASAFAACVLENVERFGEILDFEWRHARIEVTAHRQDGTIYNTFAAACDVHGTIERAPATPNLADREQR